MEVKDIESRPIQLQEAATASVVAHKQPRKRNMVVFVVVCALNIALLALLANQLLTPAQKGQDQSQSSAAAGSTDVLGDVGSPLVGKMAPAFTLSMLKAQAGNVSLADFKGRPVILNFWASWCDPCKEETPFLQKTWTSLQTQGVALIGVDGLDNAHDAQKFVQQYGVTYPLVQDTINGATAIDYGVLKFPETIFIDRHGVVVGKWSGELNDAGLKFEMKKLLA